MTSFNKIVERPLYRHLITFVAFLSIVWAVGKPHAENLIEDTVKDKFESIEKTQEKIKSDVKKQSDTSIRVETKIENIEKSIDSLSKYLMRRNERN